MKTFLLCALAFAGTVVSAVAGEKAPPPIPVAVIVDGATNTYNLAAVEAEGEVKGAKDYVDKYADNVQADKDFKAHEAVALATVRQSEPLYGTWWAIFPPLLAIVLALITKEVYSSLFLGIVSGGVLYAMKADGFVGMFETTLTHVVQAGFIEKIADAYNVGILTRLSTFE